MPNYDYKCSKCSNTFTISKSMADSTIPCCPDCNVNDHISRIYGKISLGGVSSAGESGGSCTSCPGGSCSTCK